MGFLTVLAIFMCNFAVAQPWIDDLEDARKLAVSNNKKILLYFAVSESCEPCRQLEERVFASDEFIDFAASQFILVKPEFREHEPIETKAEKLMIIEKYNKDGFFPLVVIIDRNLKIVGKAGAYNGESTGEYIRNLKKLMHQ